MSEETRAARYRDKRMQEAVYVAAELFLKEGIANVKMTDVADGAAMGVASLYRYFGSKNVLVVRAGALLWQDVRKLYEHRFEPPALDGLSGIERIRHLFSLFEELYRDHREFASFIGELDAFLWSEEVPEEELVNYENSLLDFFSVFREAFDLGVADGSVSAAVEPVSFYRTLSHAVSALEQKLIRGPLLPGDRLDDPAELHLLFEMALSHLRPRP